MRKVTLVGWFFLILAQSVLAFGREDESWTFQCDPLLDQAGATIPGEPSNFRLKMKGISRSGGEPIVTLIVSKKGQPEAQLEMMTGTWRSLIDRDTLETMKLAFTNEGQVRAYFTTRKSTEGMSTSVTLSRQIGQVMYTAGCY